MIDQPANILVVDDEKPIRRFLKASLQGHGYTVFEAATGAEAMQEAASHHPDVIILDLGLPDMDGTEVTRNLREWSSVPIIVLSVRDHESDKIAALDAGADDYLTKPFGIGELLARIRVMVRRAVSASIREIVYTLIAAVLWLIYPRSRIAAASKQAVWGNMSKRASRRRS